MVASAVSQRFRFRDVMLTFDLKALPSTAELDFRIEFRIRICSADLNLMSQHMEISLTYYSLNGNVDFPVL